MFKYYDQFYNKKFALKRALPNLDEKEVKRFKQEFKQLHSLSHPYIIEVYRTMKQIMNILWNIWI